MSSTEMVRCFGPVDRQSGQTDRMCVMECFFICSADRAADRLAEKVQK